MKTTTEEREEKIMKLVKRQVGYEPVGMLDLLHILASPELVTETVKYLEDKSLED